MDRLKEISEFLGGAAQRIFPSLLAQLGIAQTRRIKGPAMLDHRTEDPRQLVCGGGDDAALPSLAVHR